MVSGVGSVRLGKLLEFFGKPENVINAPRTKLMQVLGVGEKIAGQISSLKAQALAEELRLAKRHNLRIMTCDDDDYPKNLKNIYDPPIVLYLKGELREEDIFSLSIVGSRRASFYGREQAEKFSASLAQAGMTVVSGMARGVDTCAHRGALKAGGRSIAVIGSGFADLYPPENSALCEEIAYQGCVVSEFAMRTPPLRENFPRRNRVVSGLSLGVLVVEAAQNSGALITADFALERGREVFALPGRLDAGNSYGANELIKHGAKLVTSPEDILEEFVPALEAKPPAQQPAPERITGLSAEEERLCGLIRETPLLIDEIAARAVMGVGRLSALLLGLQLKKMIKELPGKHFVKA